MCTTWAFNALSKDTNAETIPCRSSCLGDVVRSTLQQNTLEESRDAHPFFLTVPIRLEEIHTLHSQLSLQFPNCPSSTDIPLACCNVSFLNNRKMPEQPPDMDPHANYQLCLLQDASHSLYLWQISPIHQLVFRVRRLPARWGGWTTYLEGISVVVRRFQISRRG